MDYNPLSTPVAYIHALTTDGHSTSTLKAVKRSSQALAQAADHVGQLLLRVPFDESDALWVKKEQQARDSPCYVVEGHLLERFPRLLEPSRQNVQDSHHDCGVLEHQRMYMVASHHLDHAGLERDRAGAGLNVA